MSERVSERLLCPLPRPHAETPVLQYRVEVCVRAFLRVGPECVQREALFSNMLRVTHDVAHLPRRRLQVPAPRSPWRHPNHDSPVYAQARFNLVRSTAIENTHAHRTKTFPLLPIPWKNPQSVLVHLLFFFSSLAQKLEDPTKLLVAMYAWDSNSFPGLRVAYSVVKSCAVGFFLFVDPGNNQ